MDSSFHSNPIKVNMEEYSALTNVDQPKYEFDYVSLSNMSSGSLNLNSSNASSASSLNSSYMSNEQSLPFSYVTSPYFANYSNHPSNNSYNNIIQSPGYFYQQTCNPLIEYKVNEAPCSSTHSQYSDSEKHIDNEKKVVKKEPQKARSPRKRTNRFDGLPEEEVMKKFLPDHLDHNLDIIIIGINPGLFAAYKGHHYAGPGNHFWKCLYMSGITPEPYTAYDDFRMIEFGIGFTNIVARTTRGSNDLSRKEIEEGGKVLLTKLQYYKPKIAVFNGKGIYEIFSKKKDFMFGKQPDTVEGTNTHIWVMPSSSSRCSQLPRAADKVPFYIALKKFRDYLNGKIPSIAEDEIVFGTLSLKNKVKQEESPIKVER